MKIFRCIVSGLFALGGASFYFNQQLNESFLLLLIAASVLPYDAANKPVCFVGGLCGFIGILCFRAEEYYLAGVLGIAILVIIGIKGIRLHIETQKILSAYRGYDGSGSGYSGSGSGYSSSDSSYEERRRREEEEERERRWREEEEHARRLHEEAEENSRRLREQMQEELQRERETEEMARRRYGCSANIAANWDNEINNRLR